MNPPAIDMRSHEHPGKLTNMEPENGLMEEENPFGSHDFQVLCSFLVGGCSPTPLKNMFVKLDKTFPTFRGEQIQIYLKLPPT